LREALVDFVECEPIDDEDADVSELAIQHIEKEIDRCEAEYVNICFCLIDDRQTRRVVVTYPIVFVVGSTSYISEGFESKNSRALE
jgi:hypothetical protein